jgi:signal transduction histidine kinase
MRPWARTGRTLAQWKGVLPLGFVMASLLALAAVPVLMNRWIEVHHHQIETVTQPARVIINSAKGYLAHEVSLTRGFVLTEDRTFLVRYRQVQEDHEKLYDELRPLVRWLGPRAYAPFVEVERLVQQRDEETTAFLRGEMTREEFAEQVPGRQVVFEEALAALELLDKAVTAAEQEHRERVATLRSRGFWITAALILLALAASVVILLVGRRDLRLLEEAQERRLQLAQLVETRSRLIRGIGHDVKNPLGAADGYAGLLEEGVKGELTPEQKQYVVRMRRMHRSILDIINNLLEFSRAETGEREVAMSQTDVDEVVRETAEDYGGAAQQAGLDFHVRTDDLPLTHTDPARLRAIVGNLLSNAIKYTPAGGRVEVRTGVRSDRAAPGAGPWITVDVEDTGPGIPPEASEHIFEEYSRLDPAAAEGAGIGLAVSRATARLLGGDVTFRSSRGAGSTFTLWLPDRNGPDGDS